MHPSPQFFSILLCYQPKPKASTLKLWQPPSSLKTYNHQSPHINHIYSTSFCVLPFVMQTCAKVVSGSSVRIHVGCDFVFGSVCRSCWTKVSVREWLAGLVSWSIRVSVTVRVHSSCGFDRLARCTFVFVSLFRVRLRTKPIFVLAWR